MGMLNSGPFSPLRGRTGNNVGRWTKGKNVFSIRPHKSSKPATAPQVQQRTKFKLLNEFFGNLNVLIKSGFHAYLKNGTAMNAAVSYNFSKIIKTDAGGFDIVYSLILFSRGTRVLEPRLPEVQSLTGGIIEITWQGGSVDKGCSLETDYASFLLINPLKEEFKPLPHAVQRLAETFSIELPSDFAGDPMHCYMSFESLKGDVSNSVYLGCVEVRP
jgi:hypothetical protein